MKKMIYTVTLNPAMDKTARVEKIIPGGLNRMSAIVTDPSGKGINVSRMIKSLGGDSVATGFIGGETGDEIEKMLRGMGIPTDFVRIKHNIRTNLKVLSPDFGLTEFNEPGAAVTQAEMGALREKLIQDAGSGTMFVFSGSLPQNAEALVYRELISAVKAKGATAFLDADGEAFREGLKASPDYIKPNKFELAQYFDVSERISTGECAALCRRIVAENGVKAVALSMGAEGALFVSREEIWYAPALPVKVLSTVGAGDCMVGALAAAVFYGGTDLRDAAALSMAASAGAVTMEGTKPPGLEWVEELRKRVVLESIA
ncbi:MAG: 1-phosphofructokinase family hexose kinase [Clostridiales bacterium]|jgi:1-phosphofructokinase|nr:1-phosphofructokinase family hexose kinase [Clostridiales bacterium]